MIPPPLTPPPAKTAKPLSRWLLLIPIISAATIALFLFRVKRPPAPVCGPELPNPDSIYHTGATLDKNEVLAQLLRRFCLTETTINTIYAALRRTDFDFRKMKPGDSVSFYYQGLNLARVDYHPNLITTYEVSLDSAGNATAQKIIKPVDTVKCIFTGTIENSLWNSLLKIGGTPELVVNFAEILRYDIDFFTECNNGDTFELLVDQLNVDGKTYGYGRIYAVHYKSKTENVYGFYFKDPSGRWDYYNEKGQSLRKTVLRSPLSFAKVSSYFGMRFHPILRIYRPHQGVDYVAPRGTPVSAIADGTVIRARWCGGYGHLVEIKHSGGLVSRYGHLSKYGPGIKEGRFVRQGATVGYVGATGLATGPHLHFEIRKGGKPVNPLKVIPPRAEPVAKKYLQLFNETKDYYLSLIKKVNSLNHQDSSITNYKPISISK
ncbi:M23 family metallopeptidase [candidate division WOR-3 bacterium]|nr:M23 family metallopeptidase [candidate division WOR-3 bacterium]